MTEEAIRNIITVGEGVQTEFKEATFKIPKDFYETVCAFLNRSGGDILLGVKDNGEIEGVVDSEANKMIDDIITTTNSNTKIIPSFLLEPEKITINGKAVIYTYVPSGSQIYKCNGDVFDRHGTADVRVKDPQKLREIYDRKNTTFAEAKVYPALKLEDLDASLFEKMKPFISLRSPNDPWLLRTPEQILRDAGLYKTDYLTGKEGLTLAAALIFGTDSVIKSITPHYSVDVVVRKVDTDRYDDRLTVECNLIESYEKIINFISQYLPDKFHLEGITRIDLRAKILREVIANLIAHRDYTSRVPATVYVYNDRLEVLNGNQPFYNGRVDLNTYTAHQKNPLISAFLRHLGWVEKLGSGLNSIRHYSSIYTPNSVPEFYDEGNFKAVIPIPTTKGVVGGAEIGEVIAVAEVMEMINCRGGVSGGVSGGVNDAVSDAVNDAEGDAVSMEIKQRLTNEMVFIIINGGVKLSEMMKEFKLPKRTAERDIQYLRESGFITYEGTPKTGKYVVTEKTKQIKVKTKKD